MLTLQEFLEHAMYHLNADWDPVPSRKFVIYSSFHGIHLNSLKAAVLPANFNNYYYSAPISEKSRSQAPTTWNTQSWKNIEHGRLVISECFFIQMGFKLSRNKIGTPIRKI